ncbi:MULTISPECIES: hypothetical protein [Streptomyces]|uniref:Uncharacterized protein n=1 Tax=Streptomyces mordarskii TaxID=1226758 RepID=A0ABP3LRJ3_9ACTN
MSPHSSGDQPRSLTDSTAIASACVREPEACPFKDGMQQAQVPYVEIRIGSLHVSLRQRPVRLLIVLSAAAGALAGALTGIHWPVG